MGRISISRSTVGNLAVNCWFLVNKDTNEAVVFDPGGDVPRIKARIDGEGLSVRAILLTHGHADHIGGAEELKRLTEAPVYAMQEEEPLLLNAKTNLSVFILGRPMTLKADHFLTDGQELTLCGLTLRVMLTPGHTPGGCAYYCEEADAVFSGDTLFQASVGRSDFPGGSGAELLRSVRERLFQLPDGTRVCPGHGDETTIEYEKKYNPFI